MKNLFKNAAQAAAKSLDNKGFTTTGSVVAAGILGVFGILSRPEEAVVDNSEFIDADSDKVTETIEHVSKATEDDFILADEAPSVQNEEVEEVEEIEEVEEVVEVESDDSQDLASEEITETTQSIQQATEQVTETHVQPAQNNVGQAERDAEARRAEAARQEEEAQKRAEEEARIAAEEAARIAAEEEAARRAEQAQRVEANHNQPNVLLRNGSVVAEGTGRVWYYNGPVDGLSYTDNSGNEKSGNVNSIKVNANFVGQDGINYSAYTNGRMVPIVIQTTEGGYILHMFGR